MKDHEVASDDVIVCAAEYTGRYIYPIVCVCGDFEIFFWMEDPIKD